VYDEVVVNTEIYKIRVVLIISQIFLNGCGVRN